MKQEEKLEEAKRLYQTANADQRYVLESLFPELKESKDERIRKAIKYCIKQGFIGCGKIENVTPDECLAWLEKQGESIKIKKGKNYLCTKTHKYAGVEWIEGVKYYSPEDYSLVNQGCTCYCPKYSKEEHNNFFKEVEYDGCLEKQGEQKETLCDKCKKEQPSHSCQDITALGRCYIEHINTSSNKVETKFHEGDWVVYKNDICQIVKREEGCNKLVTTFGIEKELVNERNLSTARLWTIEDAREGDVLTYKNDDIEWILIYKNILPEYHDVPNHVLKYHALFTGTDFYHNRINSIKGKNYASCFTPATKEQRDLLFQKIHDTGYEWNAEKKEVKKIKNFPILSNSAKTGKNWSEEDEKCIDNCCLLIGAADSCYEKTFKDDCIHYLQNLKKRMGI